ncbi:FHA domain-containing protein [Myxococcus sp. K38C18041901]|uniref:FHA domain-containing protein n=1 Tax=Myxococcus guangdongensis TaxID=2906760 RepID=UPI0020A79371|nr:FHA domain-containing protein [Myxococcus guangdongensis]MCP3058774.1 FHA domain-containing protein [Myxococcus guangdongensis]
MARALLLSLLVRQHLALKEKFRAKYPHPWLVWEAGAWNVPETVDGNVGATRLPLTDLKDCLPAGDAMCFELVALAERGPIRLGRASQNNALVVNDATVSREQLILTPQPDASWHVARVADARPVKLDGRELPDAGVVLTPGARLEVGDVRLTFHDAAGFDERISRIAAQVLAQTAPPR